MTFLGLLRTMGFLQIGIVTKTEKVTFVTLPPYLPSIKAPPTHYLSSAVLPTAPFCLLCSASGERYLPCQGLPPDHHPIFRDPQPIGQISYLGTTFPTLRLESFPKLLIIWFLAQCRILHHTESSCNWPWSNYLCTVNLTTRLNIPYLVCFVDPDILGVMSGTQ